ncbi:MAG TPA: alpha/beta fold hydrolase [Thermomicrobiaceae bacterium]|nr:alpha/beta fold hydrolase [Thermomicrobiaceae bacterium]
MARARLLALVALVLAASLGCRVPGSIGVTAPTASASPTAAAAVASTALTVTPSPTLAPTATETPTPAPTATPIATPTPAPTPTATPNPDTEPVAWYIDSLRTRAYNGCCLERTSVYEHGASYTAWLVAYRSEGLRITGLMAVPNGSGPFPAVIVNHGHFAFNDYGPGWDTIREVRYLASHGYVAVAPDYRNYAGSDQGDYTFVPGYVYDVRNLILALQQLPEVRGDRIGMLGHSMGAGITLQEIVSGADVQVAALFGTVSADEAQYFDARVHLWSATGQPDANTAAFFQKYGTPAQSPGVYAKMSPANYFANVQIPVIIHHGTADTTTPLQWAKDVDAGLRAAGKSVQFYVYPGAGHSFNGADWDLAMARTLALFDSVLKK